MIMNQSLSAGGAAARKTVDHQHRFSVTPRDRLHLTDAVASSAASRPLLLVFVDGEKELLETTTSQSARRSPLLRRTAARA